MQSAQNRFSRRVFFPMLVLSSALISTACNTVVGSGTAAQRNEEVTPFTGVEFGQGLDAQLFLGTDAPVVLIGDDNIIDLFTVTVEDDVLKVFLKDPVVLSPRQPLVLQMSSSTINSIDISGAAKLTTEGVRGEALALNITEGADFSAQDVIVGSTTINLADGSGIFLNGASDTVDLVMNGGSDADLQTYIGDTVTVEIGGASSATIRADDSITGVVKDASTLSVFGSAPSGGVTEAGGGTVSFAGDGL